MSLPWFPFNIEAYIGDTMRLTTEAHGAYLLLMLDYYSTGKPCPDDNMILAAVAKLPEEAWVKHRKVLAPFFDIREGHWFHSRIEAEMQEAMLKHAASIAQAQKAAAARWGHTPASGQRNQPKRPRNTAKASNDARAMPNVMLPAMPGASSEQCLENAHLHKHTTTPFGRSSSDDDDAKAINQVEGRAEGLGTEIPSDWSLSEGQRELCRKSGSDDATIDEQSNLFVAYNVNRGTLSPNWINTWSMWWARHLERARKVAPPKAPPRIEVNAPPPPEQLVSNALKMFARGGPWSHKAFGPEPGQLGCRIHPDVIRAHGIDPGTGAKLREPAQ